MTGFLSQLKLMVYPVMEIGKVRKTKARSYFCLLCILMTASLRAQDISTMQHKLLTSEDGLPSEFYYTVFQDSKGFLWMTTGESVLVKYNGHSYEKINYDPNDSIDHTLYTNIMALKEDDDGVIWFGMLNGFFKYDPKISQTTIKSYPVRTGGGWFPNGVFGIVEDTEENLWLATGGNNLHIFNKKTETFSIKKMLPELKDNIQNDGFTSQDIIIDKENTIWLATSKGLFKYEKKTESFRQYIPSREKIRGDKFMWSLEEGDTNTIWVGTYRGLYLFDKKREEFHFQFIEADKPPAIENQFVIHALTRDNAGNVWFRSRKNLYKIVSAPEKYTFEKKFGYNVGAIMSTTFSLIFDDSGNIILSTDPQSLHVFSPKNKHYNTIIPETKSYEESNNFSSCLLKDRHGIIWMGTSGNGLFRIDPETKIMQNYRNAPGDNASISANEIHCLFEDKKGRIWIGTDHGVNKIIQEHDGAISFKRYLSDAKDQSSLKCENTFLIFEDDQQGLWFLNFDALTGSWMSPDAYYMSKYDPIHDNFFHLKINADVINEVPAHTKKNEIWIPRYDGIFRIIPPIKQGDGHTLNAEKIILYQHGRIEAENIPFDFVNPCPILHFQKDTVWFGSYFGLGRLVLKPEEKDLKNRIIFSYYNENKGLEDKIIIGLINDVNGNIWVAGKSNTLTRFNPNTELSTSIQFAKPVRRDFDDTRLFKDSNEDIYYTNRGGIFRIDPNTIFQSKNSYPLYITNLKISGKTITSDKNSLLKNSISSTHTLQLRYDQNNLEFEFSMLDYRNPSKIQYLYQFEGLQEDWISSGNTPNARFFQVPPGKYTFSVKAADSEGIWNTKGASISIIITPPWWNTLLAKIFYVILPLILIAVYIRLRTRRLKREKIRLEGLIDQRTSELQDANEELNLQKEIIVETNEELKVQNQRILEMDEMKTRFFANISHEFRTPLTLITSPVEEMLLQQNLKIQDRENLELIYRNAIRLLGLVNQLLDLSKLDAGKLKIELIESDICKFLHSITRGFTPLAERKKIDYQVSIQPGKHTTWFDYDKLYKITSNLLNNAFKFTPERGTIDVWIELSEKQKNGVTPWLEMAIRNSGELIPAEHLNRIFDRFFQAPDSKYAGAGGTGIGLSLTNELLGLLQGSILVTSDLSSGNKFTINLPLGKAHLDIKEYTQLGSNENPDEHLLRRALFVENQSAFRFDEEIAEKDRDKSVVLVVEDNPDVLQLIHDHLKKSFIVKQAMNGKQGWKKANALVPDLIISDGMMPEVNGRELCKRLKNSEITSHIPIIMLTALADSKNKIEGLEVGADDYIPKPFNMRELIVRSRNLIEQRKKLHAIYQEKIAVEPLRVNVASADERFLKKAIEIINNNLSDADFDVNRFYPKMHMSRNQLLRKLKSLLNQTPSDLIRIMRLKRAEQLLKQNYGNIAEVAFEAGFSNLSYFAKCFREQYGVLPSEYK